MKSLLSIAALAASLFANGSLAAESIDVVTLKGCYKAVGPSMQDLGPFTFQSYGYCRSQCQKMNKPAMAVTKGSNCYCGDKIPNNDAKVNDSQCKTPCDGFDKQYCGGKNAFFVFATSEKDDPDTEEAVSSSTSSPTTASTTAPMRTITQSGATVIVTAGGDPANENKGPNKAGIAAGVVVGVLVLCAIIGGAFFYMKYKKRKEVMEEYRRNATISNFVSGGKPFSEGSMSDSRLDPSMMSQRRQSNGSIADDQDFSRRILKVTNPDSHY